MLETLSKLCESNGLTFYKGIERLANYGDNAHTQMVTSVNAPAAGKIRLLLWIYFC